MSAARLSALSVLVFGGPTTLGRLAEAEQVSAPTMSRLVTGLERDGYVRRRASSADRRLTVVEATGKGRRTLEQGRERRISELEELVGRLDADELDVLARAASTIEHLLALPPSAAGAYSAPTAERRWSGSE